jgi:cysteine desulfurase family protein (TIGR01976 family)
MNIDILRAQFPALQRQIHDQPAVFLDGPAGSQVPGRVIDAISRYLAHGNANTHGAFITSVETDALLASARQAVADLLGSDDPDLVIFGPNMTTLTFALSRAMGRTWSKGDEVIVTRLDHDANVTPWVCAANDAGATVHAIGFRPDDTTLDVDELRARLSPRTRLVAVGAASNATGTRNPVAEITALAHAVGARVFVDAVHYAPHALMDVAAWGCDFVACSAYKFFGPHLGLLWGKRELMETLPSYQVRPAAQGLPDRWNVGTQSHEAVAGTLAAIEYLEDLGRGQEPASATRRQALRAAFATIEEHERGLLDRLLAGLAELSDVRVRGIADRARMHERVPTVSFTHARLSPQHIAARLGEQGIFVWAGNFYAIEVTRALGLEPQGMVRVGLLHYNTAAEVDRLLRALAGLAA